MYKLLNCKFCIYTHPVNSKFTIWLLEHGDSCTWYLTYFVFIPFYYTTSFTGWNLTFQSTEWWLNGCWMATEWWRERWISVAFQSPLSYHSVDWMAGTVQWPFSQVIFWKIKLHRYYLWWIFSIHVAYV